jgi:hypothetical protein
MTCYLGVTVSALGTQDSGPARLGPSARPFSQRTSAFFAREHISADGTPAKHGVVRGEVRQLAIERLQILQHLAHHLDLVFGCRLQVGPGGVSRFGEMRGQIRFAPKEPPGVFSAPADPFYRPSCKKRIDLALGFRRRPCEFDRFFRPCDEGIFVSNSRQKAQMLFRQLVQGGSNKTIWLKMEQGFRVFYSRFCRQSFVFRLHEIFACEIVLLWGLGLSVWNSSSPVFWL